MLSFLKVGEVYYPFYEVIKLVMIQGEVFYVLEGLDSRVHFEVSSWDQRTFLQNGLNNKDFGCQIIQLAADSKNPIFILFI